MNKLSIHIFIAFYLLISACESNKENTYPNIIIFLTDDQGWGDLSINGNNDIYTPNIDQMALDGVRFNRFFVSPVCSPTRAEILTGRHHVRTGVYDVSLGGERINIDEETIAAGPMSNKKWSKHLIEIKPEIKLYDDIIPIFNTLISIITKQQEEIDMLKLK